MGALGFEPVAVGNGLPVSVGLVRLLMYNSTNKKLDGMSGLYALLSNCSWNHEGFRLALADSRSRVGLQPRKK